MKLAVSVLQGGKGLEHLRKKMLHAADAAMREGAEAVQAEALALLEDGAAPETDTGALARSLRIEAVDGGYHVGADAPYAFHVEFGTRARPSDGWLSLALNRILPQFKRRMPIILGQALKGTAAVHDGTRR